MWTAILCSLLVALVTRIFWRRWKYDLHKVPSPPGWPILGHTLDFVNGEALRNIAKWTGHGLKHLNYPKLMRVDVLGKSLVVVTDDEFIRNTMLSTKDPFPRVAGKRSPVLPMIGNNPEAKSFFLHAEPTPYVKAVRRIYSTAFQTNNLKGSMPKIHSVMGKMISIVESRRKDGPVEVQKMLVSTTLDIIGSIAFEMNLGNLDNDGGMLDIMLETAAVAREAFSNPLKTVYCKHFPNSEAARYTSSVFEKMNNKWKELTDEILARDDPVNGEEPIWYGLKHLKDPETEKRMDYDVLLAEVASVVISGTDSTGHQLAWIIGILASRPDIVEKIVDELKQYGLYGDTQKELQFEDLSNLTYLNAVVREGIRVAHVFPGNAVRSVPRDMSILGYRIPKGTTILQIGNRAYQIDADWNDPESFKPERWLDDDAICRSHNLQFSTGPRDCPGQRLAMLEMRVAIATILQRYEISLVGSCADIMNNTVTRLTVEAVKGIWINFAPRKTSA